MTGSTTDQARKTSAEKWISAGSVGAKRDAGINARASEGGHGAGEERHPQHQQTGRDECHRIGGADAEE